MTINTKDRPQTVKASGSFRAFNPYDAIFKTDPTVFVGLEYASISGIQILFQDATCTVPVENIGDPIGGVIGPRDLSIVAMQTTDADRPIWGGEEVGALFNGTSQFLESPEAPTTSLNFISQTGVFSAAARCAFDRDGLNSDTMLATSRGLTSQPGLYLMRESRNDPVNRFRAFHASSSSVREVSGSGNSLPVDTDSVSIMQGDGSTLTGYVENILQDSASLTTGGDITQTLTIGTTPESRSGRFLSGSMKYAAIWSRVLTSAERGIL